MGTAEKEGSDRGVRSLVLKRKIRATLERCGITGAGARIVVGVSGGSDSVCLLKILCELRDRMSPDGPELRAVHVHHGLRRTADRDAAFVQDLCEELEVPLRIIRVNAAAEAAERGMTVEEAGRAIRYAHFREACAEWDREETSGTPPVIAVAHHMEDRAETILFHLCRGSSLAGLSGIRPVSGYQGIRIIRPLIDCTKEEIRAYLQEENQSWCEDETNRQTDTTRNYIRLRILPALEANVNSGTVAHIARIGEEAEEIERYLKSVTDRAVQEVCLPGEPVTISVRKLLDLPGFLQKRVLYRILTETSGHRKDVTAAHIEELQSLLHTQGSAQLRLPYDVVARREYDSLRFYAGETGNPLCGAEHAGNVPGQNFEAAADLWPVDAKAYSLRILPWSGNSGDIPTGPYTKWVDYDKICKPVQLRTGQKGDVLILDGEGRSKKLSRVMVDEKIPAALRGRMVLPFGSDQHVLWIPGYRIGADVRIDAGTRKVLEISFGFSVGEG